MCPTIFFMNALFNSRLSVLSPSIFTFLREGCTRVPCPRGATWRRAAKWVRVWCGVVFCIILFNILLNYLVYHYISLYCIALLCTALCCIVYHYIILHGRMHSISFSCLIVSIIVQHSKCTVLTQYGQRKIFLHTLNSVLSWVCVSQSSAVGYRQSHLMGCQVLWRSTAIKNNQMYTKSDLICLYNLLLFSVPQTLQLQLPVSFTLSLSLLFFVFPPLFNHPHPYPYFQFNF